MNQLFTPMKKKKASTKKTYGLNIDTSIMDALDEIADTNSRSRSNQAELALKEFIQRQKAVTKMNSE